LHPTTADTRETEWKETADPATKLVEARQRLRNAGLQVETARRAVLAASADRIVIAKGECISGDGGGGGGGGDAMKACEAALGTLETGVEAKERVAIDLDAAAKTSTSASGSTSASASGSTSTSTSTSTTGTHVPLPPMPIPQEEPRTDLRPVVVGAAVIALAFGFWWNRRRRDRYAAEDRGNK
jgi:hypothetical protein